MKILFVNEKCGFFGGVEQNIADSAAGLRARGHQCYLAYGSAVPRRLAEYQAIFNACFSVRLCAGDSADGAAARFADVFGRIGPDVLYLHKLPEVEMLGDCVRQARTVRMVHDHDLCCPRRHKYFSYNGRVCTHPSGWRCWVDAAFLTRSDDSITGLKLVSIQDKLAEMRRNYDLDVLLVGSRFMHEELLQNGFPKGKIRILPPLPLFPAVEPSAIAAQPQILYVGQLIHGKGVDLLLQALSLLACRFKAVIVGSGNAQAELQRLCQRLGLADKVRFRGWVDHSELPQLYESTKVVVVPSRWPEPFGMIGLEAMRHSRPIVAFNVGGISDWLEHEVNGLLVPEQDTAAMARSIERVLADTAWAESLGRNGWRKAERDYSFATYMDRLEGYLGGQKTGALTIGAAQLSQSFFPGDGR